MNQEKANSPVSGYLMLVIVTILFVGSIWALIVMRSAVMVFPLAVSIMLMPGFFFVNPNSSVVLVLFGDYRGTVKTNGFYWVNPFFAKKPISLRARNFDSDKIKVNDKVGNPIQIGVILVWQVKDTFRAAFEVETTRHL